MSRRWLIGLGLTAVGGLLAVLPSGSNAQAGSESRRTPLVQAIERALPSTVSITSEKKAASNSRWPFSTEEKRRPRVSGMGTGVVLDERGFILTNYHVVDGVHDLRVFLHDGSNYPGEVLQIDTRMDLALVKIDPPRPLTPVTIGTSSDLMLGETVITIGNAFGYENTASVGIISALGRNVTLADDQVYRNLIQTDAGINPGNSGGPLLNIDGELIGINVATRAGAQGIGFALPIDDVKRVVSEMMSTRSLNATWHGLVAVERMLDGARRVIVSAVEGGSPAEEAGFRPGDRVVRVNDLVVRNPIDIERGLLELSEGERARLVVDRQGENRELELEIEALPRRSNRVAQANLEPSEQIRRLLGMRVAPISSDYLARVSPKLRGGLYVEEVMPGGIADRAAIRPGDILVGIHVGSRDWETIRPDNILYILRQSEAINASMLQYYIIRQNMIQQGQLSMAEIRRVAGSSHR